MCVLCWQFLSEGHWTEQVFEAEENAATGTVGSTREHARRRDRYQRTRILNQILHHYGLRLDDWHSRTSFQSIKINILQNVFSMNKVEIITDSCYILRHH